MQSICKNLQRRPRLQGASCRLDVATGRAPTSRSVSAPANPDDSLSPRVQAAAPRALEGLVRSLLGPLLSLENPSRTGWRLLGWDADAGISLMLGKGPRVLQIDLEKRDEGRPCFARAGPFNVLVRASRGGDALSAEDRAVIAQLVALLSERSTPWPADADRPAPSERAEVREVTVERVLVQESPGHYYVNPYTGCMLGCAYCYVAPRADLSRALQALPERPWGRYVDVKVNAPEILRAELARHEPGVVRLSPIVTDPYQPVERRYRITRRCLEALADARFTPVVLTRAARVTDDLALLARIPGAAVGLSIPTDDDAVRRAFEPGADTIGHRLAALAACRAAGLVTFAVVQPMLPMDPDALVAALSPLVQFVRIDRMHEMGRARPLYARAGRLDAAQDAWFEGTRARLSAGFAARGVRVDERDDLGGLVAGPAAPTAPARGPGAAGERR